MSTELIAELVTTTTTQCQHLPPRGYHCHMVRVDNESLCPYHLRQTLADTGNLNTAARVNTLLAIGYFAQLLLNTIPGVQREHQAIRAAEARQARHQSFAETQARLRAHQDPHSNRGTGAPSI